MSRMRVAVEKDHRLAGMHRDLDSVHTTRNHRTANTHPPVERTPRYARHRNRATIDPLTITFDRDTQIAAQPTGLEPADQPGATTRNQLDRRRLKGRGPFRRIRGRQHQPQRTARIPSIDLNPYRRPLARLDPAPQADRDGSNRGSVLRPGRRADSRQARHKQRPRQGPPALQPTPATGRLIHNDSRSDQERSRGTTMNRRNSIIGNRSRDRNAPSIAFPIALTSDNNTLYSHTSPTTSFHGHSTRGRIYHDRFPTRHHPLVLCTRGRLR